MATEITRTNIAIDNLSADVLAQIEAVLKANGVKAETTTSIRYESESVCGFLGLAVNETQLTESTDELMAGIALAKAFKNGEIKSAVVGNKSANASKLANIL